MEKHQNIRYRYERKFFVYNMDRISIENMILHHPAFFSEIYHERYVNNIYFDFPDFNNFSDSNSGNTNRIKSRIRWYGDLFGTIAEPVLELKFKRGLVGFKKLFPLITFQLSEGIQVSELKEVVRNSAMDPQVKLSLLDQRPVMLNRYRRKYFESHDRRFRITMDEEQSFHKIHAFNNTFLQVYKDQNNVIIELKYDEKYDPEAALIVNKLPFRVTKSSKYARGIGLIYA
jgi:hypothetical protein